MFFKCISSQRYYCALQPFPPFPSYIPIARIHSFLNEFPNGQATSRWQLHNRYIYVHTYVRIYISQYIHVYVYIYFPLHTYVQYIIFPMQSIRNIMQTDPCPALHGNVPLKCADCLYDIISILSMQLYFTTNICNCCHSNNLVMLVHV